MKEVFSFVVIVVFNDYLLKLAFGRGQYCSGAYQRMRKTKIGNFVLKEKFKRKTGGHCRGGQRTVKKTAVTTLVWDNFMLAGM